MDVRIVASALLRIAQEVLEAKKEKQNAPAQPVVEAPVQRMEQVVLITDKALNSLSKLAKERPDRKSQENLAKLKSISISLMKSERHEGKVEGVEFRKDGSGNKQMKGVFEIRTPPDWQIRGLVKSFSTGTTTYWVVLDFMRKKKNWIEQEDVARVNRIFNMIDKENPLSSGCSIWS